MSKIDTKELREIAEKAGGAGRGIWEHDRERQDDAPYKHYEFFVIDGDGNRMFGSENADAAFGCIEIEDCEEGFSAVWNESARRVIAHTVAFQPMTVLALLGEIDRLRALLGHAGEALREAGLWANEENGVGKWRGAARTVAAEIEEVLR